MKKSIRLFTVSIVVFLFVSSCFSPAKFTIVMQRESMDPSGPIHVGDSIDFTYEISNEALLGHQTDELYFNFGLTGEDIPPNSFDLLILKGTDIRDTIQSEDYLMLYEDGIWKLSINAKANIPGSYSFVYGIYQSFDGWDGTLWTMRTGIHYGHHELSVLE